MKKNRTLLISIILLALLCFNHNQAHSQTLKERLQKLKKNVKKEVNDIVKPESNPKNNKKQKQGSTSTNLNFEKGIIINSPNNFISNIELQSHKGLLRFGDINSYGRYTSRKYDYDKVLNNRIKKIIKAQENYFSMVKTKALADFLKNIDRNVLYKKYTTGTTNKERENKKFQRKLQEHLKNLAFNITTSTGQEKYFANPKHINPKPTSTAWGGGGSDEFRQMEIYNLFLNENLNDILKWSKSDFLKNGELEFYIVKALPLSEYNFEKQGFLLGNNIYKEDRVAKLLMLNGKINKNNWDYFSKNEFENNINPKAFYLKSLILNMPSSQAKGLRDKIKDYSSYSAGSGKFVFAVVKVKLEEIKRRRTLNSEIYQEQKYKYSFSEPNIDIYADEALKEKLGEVKIFLNKEEVTKIEKEKKNALEEKYNSQKGKQTIINDELTYHIRHLDVPPQFQGCKTLNNEETENCVRDLIIKEIIQRPKLIEQSKSHRIVRINISVDVDGSLKFSSRIKGLSEALKFIELLEPGYKGGAIVPTRWQTLINYYNDIEKRL